MTLLSDIAQTLVIIGEAGPDAAVLLRDGSAIQRVVAETHGARRHAMGWSIEALRRELDILRDVIVNGVRVTPVTVERILKTPLASSLI